MSTVIPLRKAVLVFRTADLCDAGILNPRFFRHNESLKVLETFDVDPDHITQIVRIRRREPLGDDLSAWGEDDFLARYRLSHFHVLDRGPDGRTLTALLRQRTSEALQGVLRRLDLEAFPALPLSFREDESVVAFCAPEEEMPRVLRVLEELALPYRVRSLAPYAPPTTSDAGLTPRQREILRLALELGYYQVPGRITQAELARVVGVSKAAMSKTLRRAEGRAVRAVTEG